MNGEIILYTTDDGGTQVRLREIDGTVWLTQAQIADLFQTSVPNINQHIKAIFEEGELSEATLKSHLIVQTEGARSVERQVMHYNLAMILAIGFRVRSPRGTRFRRWATAALGEYLVKGFVMDDARLKEPDTDYFDELLARTRVRDIREHVVRQGESDDVPHIVRGDDLATAVWRVAAEVLATLSQDAAISIDVGTAFAAIVRKHRRVGWQHDPDVENSIRNEMDDYLYDEIKGKRGLYGLEIDAMDQLIGRAIGIARRQLSE